MERCLLCMIMTIIFYVVHDTGKQYQVLPHRLSWADRVIMEVCCYNGLGGTCVVLVGTKVFSVSHISGFQEMGLIQPPWPSLGSKGSIQTVADRGQRRTVQQQQCSLGTGSRFPPDEDITQTSLHLREKLHPSASFRNEHFETERLRVLPCPSPRLNHTPNTITSKTKDEGPGAESPAGGRLLGQDVFPEPSELALLSDPYALSQVLLF